MNRPNLPVAVPVAALRAWSGTLPAQAVGVLLILAVAVVHPLKLDGGARTGIQILAVVAGFVGILVVFGGLLARAVPESDPVLPRPRTSWTAALLVALALYAGSAGCLVGTLTDGGGGDYVPAAVMLVLPAITLSLLLWWTRGAWSAPPSEPGPAEVAVTAPAVD